MNRVKLPPICMLILNCFCKLGKKMQLNDVDPLSYKKLRKFIAVNHPVDPNTGKKFSGFETITVKDYYFKLFDLCGCIRCYHRYKELKRKCFNNCFRTRKRKFTKPRSMKDVPDTESNSSDDP